MPSPALFSARSCHDAFVAAIVIARGDGDRLVPRRTWDDLTEEEHGYWLAVELHARLLLLGSPPPVAAAAA